MRSTLAFLALCAIALTVTGCAQFEGSFGELSDPTKISGAANSPVSQYDGTAYMSDSQYWPKPNDPSNDGSNGQRVDQAGSCGYGYE
jgi:hypothetical protein